MMFVAGEEECWCSTTTTTTTTTVTFMFANSIFSRTTTTTSFATSLVMSEIPSATGCICLDQHGFTVAEAGTVPAGAVNVVNIAKQSSALSNHANADFPSIIPRPPIVCFETTHKKVIIQCCDTFTMAVFQQPSNNIYMEDPSSIPSPLASSIYTDNDQMQDDKLRPIFKPINPATLIDRAARYSHAETTGGGGGP
eukprot:GHVS01049144.1.p1 GENE.GHVS01049144.1~~GHVS01049144.1.p1  ORF type:complete len:196 (+),score=33.32 GHVS01049144.1:51-638(+)